MAHRVERRAARSHGDNAWSRWATRIDKRIEAHSANTKNLSTAVGIELADIRRELADLRGELAVAKRLDELGARLDKLETPRTEPDASPSRTGLRIATGPSLIA